MSSRVMNALTCRNAREKLTRILFPKYSGQYMTNEELPSKGKVEKLNDVNTCQRGSNQITLSYSELRLAYLQRIHAIHPDKLAHRKVSSGEQKKTSFASCRSVETDGKASEVLQQKDVDVDDARSEFVELQSAWEQYDASMRAVRKNRGKNSKQDNGRIDDGPRSELFDDDETNDSGFTLFGVGCSFSDSPNERDLRNEIMEQACKGWLPIGSIGAGGGTITSPQARTKQNSASGSKSHVGVNFDQSHKRTQMTRCDEIELISDDFTCMSGIPRDEYSRDANMGSKKCLVQNFDRIMGKKQFYRRPSGSDES